MTAPAITAADVRAGVARELRALAEDSVTGPEAIRRAVEITAGKIRNAPALAERQVHDGFCHACGEPLDDARPVVAVMQAKGGGHLWYQVALVDNIMKIAGYGAETTEDAA